MEQTKQFIQEADDMLIKWNKNFSSTLITDEVVGIRICEKLEKFQNDYKNDKHKWEQHVENRFNEFMRRNNNRVSEIQTLEKNYTKLIEERKTLFNIESEIKYTSIRDLANHLAFKNRPKSLEDLSFDDWQSALNINRKTSENKNLISDICHNIYVELLRIHDGILVKLLKNNICLKESPSIKYEATPRYKSKTTETNESIYVKPDILFLLECLYELMSKQQKKWSKKEKDSDSNYGRSFLANGNGILRSELRKVLTNRYDKFLYLDVIGNEIFQTLFLLPRSIYQDLFWKTASNFAEICSPVYANSARYITSHFIKNIHEQILHSNPAKEIQSYQTADYSIIDEFYWILQYQKMSDFVKGLDKVLDNKLSNSIKIDIDTFWNKIRINFHTFSDAHLTVQQLTSYEDSISSKFAILFIENNFEGYMQASLKKNWVRNKSKIYLLYDFYERGTRCFRNKYYYFDDFQQAAFFEPDKDISNICIPATRRLYIKTILFIIFEVIGREKLFPIEKASNETLASIASIIKNYQKDTCNDIDYSRNGTYYLLWNYLNEVFEWGFLGAKSINDFRKNVLLPYFINKGIGLKNDESTSPIKMDEIRNEIIGNYDTWLASAMTP